MRTSIGLMLAAALAVSLLACGSKTPTGPGRFLTLLHVAGPAMIAPGATGQFTATAQYTDGSSEDVTNTAVWSTSSSALVIVGPGRAKGLSAGEGHVVVQYTGLHQYVDVLVLEPGTYRVSGRVTESDFPVEGALVEALSGKGSGFRATTDPGGRYALYGLAGEVQVQVSADGFTPQVRGLVVTDHAVSDFALSPTAVPVDLSGPWSLTLSASAGCAADLPKHVRQRDYAAVFTQQVTHVSLTLSSPTLGRAVLDGRVFDQALTLELPAGGLLPYSYNFERPALLEPVDRGHWLGISGSIQVTVAGSEFSGTVPLAFDYYSGLPSLSNPSMLRCAGPDASATFHRGASLASKHRR